MREWRGNRDFQDETETNTVNLRIAGGNYHVTLPDNYPDTRVTAGLVFTEYFDPDVLLTLNWISGHPSIWPAFPPDLPVDFIKMGGTCTLVRIVQCQFDTDVAAYQNEGWERELARLHAYLDRSSGVVQ